MTHEELNGFTKEYRCDYGGLSNVYKEIVMTIEKEFEQS